MQTITKGHVDYIQERLPLEVVSFFRKVKGHYGTVNVVISSLEANYFYSGVGLPKAQSKKSGRSIPYPIHFREGMTVRNILRGSKLCKDWTDHDLDNLWATVIELAIESGEEDNHDRSQQD